MGTRATTPTRTRTRCRRKKTLDKGARAWSLAVKGYTLDEIAKRLGYAGRGSVHELIHAYAQTMPRDLLETKRAKQEERLQHYARQALKLASAKDIELRLEGIKVGIKVEETLARISGVVKVAPIFVENNPRPKLDLAQFAIEDVALLRKIREKYSAIEAEVIHDDGLDRNSRPRLVAAGPAERVEPEAPDEGVRADVSGAAVGESGDASGERGYPLRSATADVAAIDGGSVDAHR